MKYEYEVLLVAYNEDATRILNTYAKHDWVVVQMNSEFVSYGLSEYRFLLKRKLGHENESI